MNLEIHNVTFDCADPDRLSGFWAQALGYEKRELPPEMRAELLAAGLSEEDLRDRGLAEDPDGEGPRFLFLRVTESKRAKNRMHLDLNATPGRRATPDEVDTEVERLVSLGATALRRIEASMRERLPRSAGLQPPVRRVDLVFVAVHGAVTRRRQPSAKHHREPGAGFEPATFALQGLRSSELNATALLQVVGR